MRTRIEPNFLISERLYPPSFRTPVHIHSKPLFCMVLDGAYFETNCGRTRYCTPATTLFHAPNQNHQEQFETSGGRSLVVEIDPDWLLRAQVSTRIPIDSTRVFEDVGPLSVIGTRLHKEFLTSDESSRLVIEGLMLEAVGEIIRTSEGRDRCLPPWLEQSRELIRDRYLGPLSLSEIAAAVNVHPVYLAQAFRKFYNTTIGDYMRELRIAFACRQLRRPGVSLSDVARQAGFADQSHFTRTFKKIVGMPPSQYRSVTEQTAPATAQRPSLQS